ncbi:MAG: DUF4097 domain-containing protein [Synergistetes bacterium]|nr:DUF4097 domain-containing protein [Synergistota bacterium]MDW8192711.1 DUF4097 family beta strand repeat-containing protein [Synergistota bacterium]
MKEPFRQVEERIILITEGTKLIIKNIYGSTKLKTWDHPELKVKLTKSILGEIEENEAEQKLKHIELKEKKGSKEVTMETMIPNFIIRPGLKFTIDLDILAPPHINLEIDTGLQKLNGSKKEGNIEISYRENFTTLISNIKGNIDISCGSADIEIKNSEGKIIVNSLSGTVQIKNCSGEMYINNESGNNYLDGCSGSITLKTKSGNVFLKNVESLYLNIKTSSGNIKADINILADGTYQLETHSGWIKLKIPYYSSCHIEFDTICGKIFSEYSFETKENKLKLGEAKGSLIVKSSSGDIYLIHGFMEEEKDVYLSQ